MALLLLFPQGKKDSPNIPPAPAPSAQPVLLPKLRVRAYGQTLQGTFKGGSFAHDLSNRVQSVTSSYGRTSRTTGAADPGTMTIVLDNSDGYLDPENTASPYYGNFNVGSSTVLTVEHEFEGSFRPLGTGMLDSIDRAWGARGSWSQTVITTVDQTAELAQMIPRAGLISGRQTASERINWLLGTPSRTGRKFKVAAQSKQAVDVQPSTRRLHSVVTDGRTSLWDYIMGAADADGGFAFFNASGGFRYQSGAYRVGRGATAVLGDAANEVTVEADLIYRLSSDDVIVEAAFTTYDERYTHAVSAVGEITTGFGEAVEEGRGVVTQLSDRVQVQSLARHVWRRDSQPRRGVDLVTLNTLASYGDLSLTSPYRLAVGVGLSDRLTLNRRPPGGGDTLSADYNVESISHTVEAGTQWTTSLRLSPAPESAFSWRLGWDQLGLSTRLTW